MEDLSVYFVTTKPTLWQRIKGWLSRKRYMYRFNAAKHERIERYQKKHAYTQIKTERRVL